MHEEVDDFLSIMINDGGFGYLIVVSVVIEIEPDIHYKD